MVFVSEVSFVLGIVFRVLFVLLVYVIVIIILLDGCRYDFYVLGEGIEFKRG